MTTQTDPAKLLEEVQALASEGDFAAAQDALARAVQLRPDDAGHLHTCGVLFSQLGQHQHAHDAFRAALELQPNNAQLCQNLAAVQRFLGNLGEAEAYAERAIRIDPTTPEAVFIRSDVRKVTADDNHIDDIRELLAGDRASGAVRAQCYFALSKECEDIGAYDDAFAALTGACKLRRQSFDYDVSVDVERIDDIIANYGEAFVAAHRSGHDTQQTPVFILGMPRTGSTLIERFLTAHSKIATAGERPDFSIHLANQTRQILIDRGLGRDAMVKASVDMDFAQLGRDYMASTAHYAGQSQMFIDKLPLNYLYVGLILTALPGAKIIHTARHPMDTCYAVYKALFERAYPFSYDLGELGTYYTAYHRLMEHWRQLFPERVFDVNYEDVVTDTDPTVRSLIDFCGLDWEDGCGSNIASNEASTTASAAQVRQPVYTTSVAKWRHYEEQLAPLRERLESAGIDIR